jgi:hypothetical protein
LAFEKMKYVILMKSYTFDSDAPSNLGDMVDSEKFESYMVSPKIQESRNAYDKGMPWKSKSHVCAPEKSGDIKMTMINRYPWRKYIPLKN